jgi:hypothetical protein
MCDDTAHILGMQMTLQANLLRNVSMEVAASQDPQAEQRLLKLQIERVSSLLQHHCYLQGVQHAIHS